MLFTAGKYTEKKGLIKMSNDKNIHTYLLYPLVAA